MLKKLLLYVIAILSSFLFVACSQDFEIVKVPNDVSLDFAFIECMGQSLDEVCDHLGIADDAVKETNQIGKYVLTPSMKYHGIEFVHYLTFSQNPQALYGGGYECFIKDKGAPLTETVTALKTMLTEAYGAPTTEPALSNTIGEKNDFSDCVAGTTLLERWTVAGEHPGDIQLLLEFREEEVYVQAEYRITVPAQRPNAN